MGYEELKRRASLHLDHLERIRVLLNSPSLSFFFSLAFSLSWLLHPSKLHLRPPRRRRCRRRFMSPLHLYLPQSTYSDLPYSILITPCSSAAAGGRREWEGGFVVTENRFFFLTA